MTQVDNGAYIVALHPYSRQNFSKIKKSYCQDKIGKNGGSGREGVGGHAFTSPSFPILVYKPLQPPPPTTRIIRFDNRVGLAIHSFLSRRQL
ncbi:hypothetical protein OUZ56_027891 [Daphnia magna]|uniref:Uncharacterized protein n=1 Tax=Daphnia magna TaxID=35525 RepID=A0ABR0B287_9CRUS|nr:hypothetical protein OUZ56_027891 [Daphnia magna]